MRKNKCILFLGVCLVLGPLVPAQGFEEFIYDAGKRRDPFVPLPTQPGSFSTASTVGGHLEGIVYDPRKQSFAIFGGKPYKVGEKVGDSAVQMIQKTYVVLLVDGEEKTLRLREDEKL